ncbi:sulfite exporter TauE/SafE family protein [Pigmentiphaga sp.]|uniref:sulfite exporter TauE/SafE family protein n=1 Tax=Pigmentiphaga sp. TaxID=1977564 RepID=UPI0025F646E5|nr:sulfite exporter TauE/SafE family protein [Pigmentiphaga sp.]
MSGWVFTGWPALASVFLLGLLGGVHCAAMCGGLVMAVEHRHGERLAVLRRAAPWRLGLEALVMHAGRIASYALLGAVAGGLGGNIWSRDWLPLQRGALVFGAALLCVYGVALVARAAWPRAAAGGRAAGAWRAALVRGWTGAAGAVARSPAGRFVRASVAGRPLLERFLTGLAWGWMPCGMSLGVLAVALVAGSAAAGALTMAAFGLGTLPNLVALSGAAGWLRRRARLPAWRIAGGVAVAAFGAVGLARAATLPSALLEQGFCIVW